MPRGWTDNHREILFDVEWMALRCGMKDAWTSETAPVYLERLQKYLDGFESPQDRLARLWRMINLLGAIRVPVMPNIVTAFWQGSQEGQMILNFYEEVRREYRLLRKEVDLPLHDWDRTTQELRALYRTDPTAFKYIRQYLNRRMHHGDPWKLISVKQMYNIMMEIMND